MNAASPDLCSFIEYQKIKDKWGMTDFQEVTVLKDVVDLPDCGVGVALIHPVIQQGFDICRGDVANHLVAEDRVDLMLGSALQPVVGTTVHRGKFEYPEPSAHTFLQLCLGFI